MGENNYPENSDERLRKYFLLACVIVPSIIFGGLIIRNIYLENKNEKGKQTIERVYENSLETGLKKE